MRTPFLAALALGAALCAGAASAETLHYAASLVGASETPPTDSSGTGSATVDLDTSAKTLSWTLTYSGLSGPANMAHFHGPAPVGKSAGVQIPLTGDLTSPVKGSASITDAQAADLKAGLWYVNIHTAAHPGGEIRGQVVPAP
jgi:CHRD domain